jgi:hypothetical protein
MSLGSILGRRQGYDSGYGTGYDSGYNAAIGDAEREIQPHIDHLIAELNRKDAELMRLNNYMVLELRLSASKEHQMKRTEAFTQKLANEVIAYKKEIAELKKKYNQLAVSAKSRGVAVNQSAHNIGETCNPEEERRKNQELMDRILKMP